MRTRTPLAAALLGLALLAGACDGAEDIVNDAIADATSELDDVVEEANTAIADAAEQAGEAVEEAETALDDALDTASEASPEDPMQAEPVDAEPVEGDALVEAAGAAICDAIDVAALGAAIGEPELALESTTEVGALQVCDYLTPAGTSAVNVSTTGEPSTTSVRDGLRFEIDEGFLTAAEVPADIGLLAAEDSSGQLLVAINDQVQVDLLVRIAGEPDADARSAALPIVVDGVRAALGLT